MSYLFFLDESGHDHRNCPYEVRGGVVIHARDLWQFIQAFSALEQSCFGTHLAEFGVEIKGSRLLEKKRFKHAAQGEWLDDGARRKYCLSFLNKGQSKQPPLEIELRAFGQACLTMSRGIFGLLKAHHSKIFAAVVPRSTKKPATFAAEEFLRKDQVYLLERYFHFVHRNKETGLLVFDDTDGTADKHFIQQIERYYTRTAPGRFRSSAIVPVPIFVESDLTRAIQAADICIYAINWGFRVPRNMNAESRLEIEKEFSPWIEELQATGRVQDAADGYHWYSIVFVADPFGPAN